MSKYNIELCGHRRVLNEGRLRYYRNAIEAYRSSNSEDKPYFVEAILASLLEELSAYDEFFKEKTKIALERQESFSKQYKDE